MADKNLIMGVDIGSAATKCVIMRENGTIAAEAVVPAGTGTTGPSRAVSAACEAAGTAPDEMSCVAATGYGRNTFSDADICLSELVCHAKGAVWLFPESRTVADVGGQDVKVLTLSSDGKLSNFIMNDKCAAGTGRFLEVMARVLETDVSLMDELAAGAKEPVEISSTCTVFAESEVISRLSQGSDKRDIAAGIHHSVAVRVASLCKRSGVIPPLFMTGGLSHNKDVVRALRAELVTDVFTDTRGQLAGAIGAAVLAIERGTKR